MSQLENDYRSNTNVRGRRNIMKGTNPPPCFGREHPLFFFFLGCNLLTDRFVRPIKALKLKLYGDCHARREERCGGGTQNVET